MSMQISGHVPVHQPLFSCYFREQLAESILHEGSTGCRVVEKFLKILQVVVQEPGQVFKPFLPSVISLCMEQVYPIIAEVGLFSPGEGRRGREGIAGGAGATKFF